MDSRNTNSGLKLKGRIDTQVHSVEKLREEANSDYDSLGKKEKMELSKKVNPEYENSIYNVTTDRFHKYFVDNLDPNNQGTEANISIEWLGLGTNGGSGANSSDTDLNTRAFEKPVTDVADNNKQILASTFVDSSEGNNNTFDELGLFTGDPQSLSNSEVFLINHATFASVTKDNTKTVTFDVTLTFGDA